MAVTYRPMKYPYTLTAKVVQFPYKYYYKHCWLFKYSFYSIFVCLPVFYQIQKLSYNPANVAKWNKIWEERYKGTGHH